MHTSPSFLSILTYGSSWNIILVLIGICSLVGCTILMERIWHLKKAQIDTNRFLIQIRQFLARGDMVDAIHFCEEAGGAIGRMIKVGILRHEREREIIEQAMEVTGRVEIAQLEKNAKILSIIAHVAPLIGLLGTVLGFIQAFSEMRMSGLVDISATRIGEAMEYALVTTAAGLVVAIPSILAYNYLVSRVESLVLEMQTVSAEVVELLIDQEIRDA